MLFVEKKTFLVKIHSSKMLNVSIYLDNDYSHIISFFCLFNDLKHFYFSLFGIEDSVSNCIL